MIEARQNSTIIYDSQMFDPESFQSELIPTKAGTTRRLGDYIVAVARPERFQLCDYCGTTSSDGEPNCRNCGAPA